MPDVIDNVVKNSMKSKKVIAKKKKKLSEKSRTVDKVIKDAY